MLSRVLRLLALDILKNFKRFLPVFKLDFTWMQRTWVKLSSSLHKSSLSYSLRNFIDMIAGESIHLNPVSLCLRKFHLMVASALLINVPFTLLNLAPKTLVSCMWTLPVVRECHLISFPLWEEIVKGIPCSVFSSCWYQQQSLYLNSHLTLFTSFASFYLILHWWW